MEDASKNHIVKKKRKRRKKQMQTEKSKKACVKPEFFDGMTNWLNLQKVLGNIEKERVPENSSTPQENSSVSKNYLRKKHQPQNKPSSKKSQNKSNFKFDFSERHSSIIASQSRASLKRDPNSKTSDCEMSDQDAESMENKQLTKVLSMDCEMVGTGTDGIDSILARVSIVNSHGDCVYDTFVTPKEKVTDYRTSISGVRPTDLKKGKDLFDVQKDVLTILDGRKVVGHDLKHDFDALFISHPHSQIRDTSKYKPFREVSGGRTPSLKKLVAVILGCNIQSGEHNSIEDAQAAMLLYLKHKHEWEKSIRSTRRKRHQH